MMKNISFCAWYWYIEDRTNISFSWKNGRYWIELWNLDRKRKRSLINDKSENAESKFKERNLKQNLGIWRNLYIQKFCLRIDEEIKTLESRAKRLNFDNQTF